MIYFSDFAAASGGNISFVGSKVWSATGGSATSVSLTDLLNEFGGTATLVEDDLVIITYAVTSTDSDQYSQVGTTGMVPVGWTAAHTDLWADDTSDANLQVSYRFMGVTPDTSFTAKANASTLHGRAYTVHVLRGVDKTTPIDVTPTTATGGNTGVPNPPAITPATPGAWISVHGASGYSTTADFNLPSDLSATTNHFRTATGADSQDATAGAGLKVDWASGSFDPEVWSGGSTNVAASWCAVSIAWRPA